MKFIAVSLIAFVVAGGVVGGVLTPRLVDGAPASADAIEIVYVDIEKLADLHPGIEAADAVLSARDIEAPKSYSANLRGIKPLASESYSSDYNVKEYRDNLKLDAVAKANEALRNLEQRQQYAVDVALSSERTEMAQSAVQDIELKEKELEGELAAKLIARAKQGCSQRLNARLGAYALRSASKSLANKGLSTAGVDKKLADAEADIARMTQECANYRASAILDADNQLAQLRNQHDARIRTSIGAKRAEENQRIAGCAKSLRMQIVDELGSMDECFNQPDSDVFAAQCGLMAPSYVALNAYKYSSRAFAGKKIRVAESSVREDLMSAVKCMADDIGVRVVFTKSDAPRAQDRTAMFRDTLRSKGWISMATKHRLENGS